MCIRDSYFGIADLAIDEEEQSDFTLFSKLTSEARVDHIIDKIEEYSVKKDGRKGLVFCSRLEEARELAKQFTHVSYTHLDVYKRQGPPGFDAAFSSPGRADAAPLFLGRSAAGAPRFS